MIKMNLKWIIKGITEIFIHKESIQKKGCYLLPYVNAVVVDLFKMIE